MPFYKRSVFWLRIAVAIFTGAMILTVHAIYMPIIVSLILTFILMPICNVITKWLKRLTKRNVPIDISILLSFVIFIAIMTGMTQVILRPLVAQLNLLAANFDTLVDQTEALVLKVENDQTQFYIPDQVKQVINEAFAKIGNYGVDGVSNLIKSVFAIAGTVVEFFVVPIITFYFMKDGKSMVRDFIGIFPKDYQAHLTMAFDETHGVLSHYIVGQIIMSCIIATLTFCGMWFMGVPYPMVIGLLAAITEWIPIVGPIVGAVPAIILGATVDVSLAVKVLIFYIVIQQVDGHLIMPQVMGVAIKLHPVVIVIALLISGTLFGVAGMILTVPATAILQIICKHLWFYDSYREKAMNTYGND